MSVTRPLYDATENGTVEFTEEQYAENEANLSKVSEEYQAHLERCSRAKRNSLLEETDWMANSDVTMSDEIKTYRQALRDLPTHSNWPNLEDSDWPTKP